MVRKIIGKLIVLYFFLLEVNLIGVSDARSFSAEFKTFDDVDLIKSDKVNCKVLGIYPTQRKYTAHVINSFLPDVVNYYLTPHGQECLSFRVRTKKNANLKISNANYIFWIVLGGWTNTKSVIRLNDVEVAAAETIDLLSDSEFRYFWITWSNGTLEIGSNDDEDPFLSYHYSIRIQTEFVGFQTKSSTGVWVVGEENPNCLGVDYFERQLGQVQCYLKDEDKPNYTDN